MKITKTQLKQIIKEELEAVLVESTWARSLEPKDPEGYNVEQEWEQEQKLSMDDEGEEELQTTSDFQIPETWGWENAPGEWSMSTARGYKKQGQAPQPGTYVVENDVIAAVDSDAKVWVFAKKNAREALQSLKDAGFTDANPRFTVPLAAMGLR